MPAATATAVPDTRLRNRIAIASLVGTAIEEVAASAVHLLTDASSSNTGQVLHVNGGAYFG
ncbi:hypothetical protein [Arsenicicoccus sp. oral taxon 190]|uniref:hypothetical protein n=1 Tax=Arsenicicoccus sp. oral taxon 190 TaxID=1658671 RepID=UPI000679EEAA|nr:hypothetical protein [Arsenicicoccus sp. oral taxon 190]AKT51013.1 hypothetical protein ADJ73_06250 [Arsenicicoccus sp. oral taxon 190]